MCLGLTPIGWKQKTKNRIWKRKKSNGNAVSLETYPDSERSTEDGRKFRTVMNSNERTKPLYPHICHWIWASSQSRQGLGKVTFCSWGNPWRSWQPRAICLQHSGSWCDTYLISEWVSWWFIAVSTTECVNCCWEAESVKFWELTIGLNLVEVTGVLFFLMMDVIPYCVSFRTHKIISLLT